MLRFFQQHSFKRKKVAMKAGVSCSAVFSYKVGYRRNGVDHITHDWSDNLILDTGLNKVGATLWNNCWTFCLFGNPVSPNPVRRDSNPITFITVGTACTASGSFFSAGDVGRLIKFNDGGGQECYISAFTSATLVTLATAPSPAIASVTGTVWYVNQTALDTLYATTNTYGSGGGDNGTTAAANVNTYKRTFVGAAVASGVTLTEIGFSNSATNANIFDRDIIAGGVSLVTGDQPLAIATLVITITPAVSTPVSNVGTGCNTAGDMIINGSNFNGTNVICSVASTGGTSGASGSMEPLTGLSLAVCSATFTLPAFATGIGATLGTPIANSTYVAAAYSSGTFVRDATSGFNISTANGTLFGLSSNSTGFWIMKFTAPFTKSSLQTFSVTSRISWQRALVN